MLTDLTALTLLECATAQGADGNRCLRVAGPRRIQRALICTGGLRWQLTDIASPSGRSHVMNVASPMALRWKEKNS